MRGEQRREEIGREKNGHADDNREGKKRRNRNGGNVKKREVKTPAQNR